MHKLAHILRLGLKELTSLRHDSVLLLFLFYAFTVAIYMPAAGSVIGVHNASVAMVDEDHSPMSRQLAQILRPPEFQPPVPLPYGQLDEVLDNGRYTFVINVPANFQADLLGGHQPAVQVNVDATAMSQAFMGAGYIGRIFQRELLTYSGQGDAASQTPVRLTTRALFNTNLEGGWFLAVIQIVNNITILAIILTGTALLREREHGTLDHLLVLPLTALEIMLAKVWSNMLVVVLCTWVSLEVIVKGALGVPLAGSMSFFLLVTAVYLFASTALGIFLATLARSTPQFGLLAIPVIIPMLLLSGGSTPLDSMPQWLQWVMQGSPSTHFVSLSAAILFRDAGIGVVWPDLLALSAIGLLFFTIALLRFRKSLAS
ncbi:MULTISPECIES: ABC transporter permease [Pseudomonas]|jgi:ABC-2 type transport system permease protein|uniref:ABC transporter permease n=1 Tax=Pseudomonas TaxID=286 RepID=UPI0003644949|nr:MULTISPECIES: ABC transporter permease [Pseudomonas]MBD9605974.1 ABC transporter permease [Pseudomonas sp. PDM08]MDR7106750.1 ABC-2 type transport system permease protein [Pseudomonas frederiksbergensis]PMY51483.1 ABC transporter permease [Pseudomonas sp. FW305-53]PMY87478.1 ABC transporter permease [Pseudomonas sp. FW303-C2]PMY94352.1 ABC transporter permease [Pseudomonas sp. FW305-62]